MKYICKAVLEGDSRCGGYCDHDKPHEYRPDYEDCVVDPCSGYVCTLMDTKEKKGAYLRALLEGWRSLDG
jgi:hypothetical protein